jgi:hypothetical protein
LRPEALMDNKDRKSEAAREGANEVDRGDVTPPHGDELISEATFGRTDRYATQDDPEAESPVLDGGSILSEEERNADETRRRIEQIDDAAAEDARNATRKRERSAE